MNRRPTWDLPYIEKSREVADAMPDNGDMQEFVDFLDDLIGGMPREYIIQALRPTLEELAEAVKAGIMAFACDEFPEGTHHALLLLINACRRTLVYRYKNEGRGRRRPD